jgi:sugar O-acyltransferase (sialic acid O-acetyltransferase NeuD family)
MSQSLIIIGTGGSAHDVLDIVEAINSDGLSDTWRVAGFLDDNRPVGSRHLGMRVLGGLSDAMRFSVGHLFINAIGSPSSYGRRPEIIASTGLPRERFATLIHPSASISSRAHIGLGVYAGHGVCVGGAVEIGDHVSLSPRVVVGHDTVIEPYAVLAPAAVVSGHCRIGRASYVGAAATIRQDVIVGARALIGMGAVVLRSVQPETTVVGNPARVLVKGAGYRERTSEAQASRENLVL